MEGSVGDLKMELETEIEGELEERGISIQNNDDGDTTIDPDVSLSYIDERLQDVLGHCQKDFEGEISVKNRGAMFGEYGSFLPTYQRSSVRSHPKSPPKVLASKAHISLSDAHVKGGHQNSVSQSSASQPARHRPASFSAGSVSASRKGSVNGNLKDGLDISPSPSQDGLTESPTRILEIMTTFPVCGSLLSPLPYDLLHLVEKEKWEDGSGSVDKGSQKNSPSQKYFVSKRRSQSPLNTLRQAAANALNEGKKLKHMADRLKNSGPGLDKRALYIHASLKFLHAASLLEFCYAESGKYDDLLQSIAIYSSTTKLCEYCACEYEKTEEMATAALAYKCMEVASLRVVYSWHASGSLQMGGESPSSASDPDNLNNQVTADKAALVEGANSSQFGGNHVITAQNKHDYMRIINFAQDVQLAMEASRKSRTAFESSITKEGAYSKEDKWWVKSCWCLTSRPVSTPRTVASVFPFSFRLLVEGSHADATFSKLVLIMAAVDKIAFSNNKWWGKSCW